MVRHIAYDNVSLHLAINMSRLLRNALLSLLGKAVLDMSDIVTCMDYGATCYIILDTKDKGILSKLCMSKVR